MFYTVKIPRLLKIVAPSLIFKIKSSEKILYLSFDDGPLKETTPHILDILKKYNAKATFFCLGKNVQKYPDIYKSILDEGHKTGIHGYSHLNGWKTKNNLYFDDIEKAAGLIDSKLFRPPYGRLKPSQIHYLKNKYKIIMWDVLSGDFDPDTTTEQCNKNVLNNVTQGSIVVYHDSLKAKEKVLTSLPYILDVLQKRGFEFKAIDNI